MWNTILTKSPDIIKTCRDVQENIRIQNIYQVKKILKFAIILVWFCFCFKLIFPLNFEHISFFSNMNFSDFAVELLNNRKCYIVALVGYVNSFFYNIFVQIAVFYPSKWFGSAWNKKYYSIIYAIGDIIELYSGVYFLFSFFVMICGDQYHFSNCTTKLLTLIIAKDIIVWIILSHYYNDKDVRNFTNYLYNNGKRICCHDIIVYKNKIYTIEYDKIENIMYAYTSEIIGDVPTEKIKLRDIVEEITKLN